MASYNLNVAADTLAALAEILAEQFAIHVARRQDARGPYAACILTLGSGRRISINAEGKDLESRFEVFSIELSNHPLDDDLAPAELVLSVPVQVNLLMIEDWLASEMSCEGAVGANSIMQCGGRPGDAPSHATSVCTYTGGIEIRSSDGAILIVQTMPAPFALYVSCFSECSTVDMLPYTRAPLKLPNPTFQRTASPPLN